MVLVAWVSHVFHYLSNLSVTLESMTMVLVAWVRHVFHYLSSLSQILDNTIYGVGCLGQSCVSLPKYLICDPREYYYGVGCLGQSRVSLPE